MKKSILILLFFFIISCSNDDKDEFINDQNLYENNALDDYEEGSWSPTMSSGSANRYFQKNFTNKSKFVPEGVEGRVEYKGKVAKIIYQLQGGLRSSMGYIGAKNLNESTKKARFVKITKAGFYESMVHSVEITQKTINYKL